MTPSARGYRRKHFREPCSEAVSARGSVVLLEHFQFEMLCISNHTACRFAEKTRFFRSLWAGRRCTAASRFTFFKVETLWSIFSLKRCAFQTIRPVVSRKKRGFSAHFGPGGAVPPPRVPPFSKVKRFIREGEARWKERGFLMDSPSGPPRLFCGRKS